MWATVLENVWEPSAEFKWLLLHSILMPFNHYFSVEINCRSSESFARDSWAISAGNYQANAACTCLISEIEQRAWRIKELSIHLLFISLALQIATKRTPSITSLSGKWISLII